MFVLGRPLFMTMLLLILLAGAGDIIAQETPAGLADKAAPNFSLPDLSGNIVRFPEDAGGPALLEFWATWCPDCREVLPGLEKIYREYGPKGLSVVTVSVDTKQKAVEPFVEENGYTFPVLLDDGSVRALYAVQRIPTLYLVDRNGRVRLFFIEYGEAGLERLEAEVKKLMAE